MSHDVNVSITTILHEVAPSYVDSAIIDYIAEDVIEMIDSGSCLDTVLATLSEHLLNYDIISDDTAAHSIATRILDVMMMEHKKHHRRHDTPTKLNHVVKLEDVLTCTGDEEKQQTVEDVVIQTTSTATTRPTRVLSKKQQRHAMAIAEMDKLILQMDAHEDSDQDYDMEGVCQLCARDMPLTRHHLIPRTTHAKYRRKGYDTETLNRVTLICRPCHSACHKLISEVDMAASYYTIELLRADERVQRWCAYAHKQRINRTKEQGHTNKLRYAR